MSIWIQNLSNSPTSSIMPIHQQVSLIDSLNEKINNLQTRIGLFEKELNIMEAELVRPNSLINNENIPPIKKSPSFLTFLRAVPYSDIESDEESDYKRSSSDSESSNKSDSVIEKVPSLDRTGIYSNDESVYRCSLLESSDKSDPVIEKAQPIIRLVPYLGPPLIISKSGVKRTGEEGGKTNIKYMIGKINPDGPGWLYTNRDILYSPYAKMIQNDPEFRTYAARAGRGDLLVLLDNNSKIINKIRL